MLVYRIIFPISKVYNLELHNLALDVDFYILPLPVLRKNSSDNQIDWFGKLGKSGLLFGKLKLMNSGWSFSGKKTRAGEYLLSAEGIAVVYEEISGFTQPGHRRDADHDE